MPKVVKKRSKRAKASISKGKGKGSGKEKDAPQNVEMDLKEWMNQGDAIVLYEHAHLLESDYHYDFIIVFHNGKNGNNQFLEPIIKNLLIIF